MKKRRNVLLVACFLAAAFAILLISPRNRQRLQQGFLTVISPFLKKGSDWDRSYREYKGGVKRLAELEGENTTLKTEADRLRAENQALRGVEAENLKLKSALGYQAQSPFTLVPARVIGRPVTNWWHSLQVDKGSADGIEIGMAVLTPDGLVGKIIQTADHASTILLVTDENCWIAASVEGSQQDDKRGFVHVEVRGERSASNLQPRMVLGFVSKIATLEPGQKIVASGAGGVFPAGVAIGRVVEFKKRELDVQAILEPAVDLATLADVFIVTGAKSSAKAR